MDSPKDTVSTTTHRYPRGVAEDSTSVEHLNRGQGNQQAERTGKKKMIREFAEKIEESEREREHT
jgi:hypothetical protein